MNGLQFADPTSPPPINPVVSNTQLLLETILLVAFMIGYYHMITSTILTLSALHQSAKNRADRSPEDQGQSGEPFSAKKIAAMLPSRTWRVFVTHVVCIVAYMGIILLMLLATLVLVGLAKTVLDLEVAYISLLLELYMFTVCMIYFVLTISLVEQVSTVEHVWGWVAIKRSATLLRGKKMTAISVLIFHTVCVYGIYILQVAIFNHIAYRERLTGGHSLQARSVLRCGNKFGLGWCVYVAYILQLTLRIGAPWTLPIAIALNVGLASLMFWFVISTTTILYFSCKATHNERGLALPMLISGKTGPRVDYEPLFCIATNECGNKLSQGAFGKFPHGKRDGFPTMNVPTLT